MPRPAPAQASGSDPGCLAVRIAWAVEVDDGSALASGVISLPASGIPPGARQPFRTDSLRGFPSSSEIAAALPPGGRAWVRVRAALARAEPWAPLGHELAAEQLPLASLLPAPGSAAAAALAATLASRAAETEGVHVCDTPRALELTLPSRGIVVSIDKSFGEPQGGTAPVSGPMRISLGGTVVRTVSGLHHARYSPPHVQTA